MTEDKRPQSDKFKELARKVEADEDEKRWDDRLRKIAKAKAVIPKSETPGGP